MKQIFCGKTFFLHCLPFLMAAIMLTSCSEKKPEGLPALYPCKIKVVQEGAPLSGVSIFLKSSESKFPSTGTTDSGGTAEIFTMGKYSGVPEGEFIITLEKRISDPEKVEPEVKDGVLVYPNAKLYSLLNPDLGDTNKSPHKIKIENKNNFIEIDAGKKVKVFLGNTGDPH